MPITPENPFKGRQYLGDVIVIAVRWLFALLFNLRACRRTAG